MKPVLNRFRIVLDTNIYISAILFGGKPEELLKLARAGKVGLLISENIKNEIAEILKRKFKFNDLQISEILEDIDSVSTLIIPNIILNIIKKDDEDNKILECAIEGKVNYIISGDHHLLELKEYQKIKILKITEFLDVFYVRE
ncbi:putative toxin-antitoxin system toxin component, PIN family [Candidatus Desantisbacteria bacterium]|nr:putative toxin-antitoxin system toxin component, PIN family [Candidatus Desantisbacteria bacterium]